MRRNGSPHANVPAARAEEPSPPGRLRLDQLLVERGLFPSREQARRAVMAGEIDVGGRRADKPSTAVEPGADLAVRAREPFVSRAGRKLAAALDHFGLDPKDLVCLDAGASTGGFTDCLLQRGATRVYALDVGYGQLDARLRADPRVVVMERRNVRHLRPGELPEACRLATVDLSFISLAKVLPALVGQMEEDGRLLVLVKPQFEAGRGQVGKGGILRDESLRRRVVAQTLAGFASLGVEVLGTFDSPIAGAGGNRETFALLRPRARTIEPVGTSPR